MEAPSVEALVGSYQAKPKTAVAVHAVRAGFADKFETVCWYKPSIAVRQDSEVKSLRTDATKA